MSDTTADNTTALTELTTEVVSAYVGNNTVAISDLPGVIATVFDSLRKAGTPQPAAAVQPPQAPAVPIRKSVQPDSIACLECGKKMKMLKRHLTTDHGLSVDDYRSKWNLPAGYPVLSSKGISIISNDHFAVFSPLKFFHLFFHLPIRFPKRPLPPESLQEFVWHSPYCSAQMFL